MKLINIISLFLLFLIACNSKEKNTIVSQNDNTKDLSTLEIRLPFESSNSNSEDDEKNFVLYDEYGKICKAELDTITKTGGSIYYSLKNGNYEYSIKTVFNEIIKNKINLQKYTSLYFYESCYNMVDNFSPNQLNESDKINIVVRYHYDERSNDEFEIYRTKGHYKIKYNIQNEGWTDLKTIDSLKITKNLKEFESKVINLREKEILDEEKYDYLNTSIVFLKYDNDLLEVYNIKSDSLIKATEALIKTLK